MNPQNAPFQRVPLNEYIMSRSLPAFVALLLLSTSLCAPLAMAQEDDEEPTGSSSAARLQVRINELEEQVRRMQGALEQTSFSNRQLKTQMEKMRGDIDYRLQALEKGQTTGAAPATTGSINTEQPAEDAQPNKYQASAPAPASAPAAQPEEAPAAQVQNFPSSHEHYSAAFKMLNQAKYPEAGSLFTAFTERYPKDPLIGNAFYWLGETFYVRKNYVKAADNFRQGYESMPTGPKASDNLLKLAMSLSALNKDKEACIVLKQVSSKFGKNNGNIRSRVEQEMNRMDCR